MQQNTVLRTHFTFIPPKRPVSRVFLHCSASDEPSYDKAVQMERWHLARDFQEIGYHYFIRKDGGLEIGRDLEMIPAAQEGHNTGTIAICLHGLTKERFTEVQLESCRLVCGAMSEAYQGKITFHGHCEVSDKSCPVFDYRSLLGLDKEGRAVI